MSKEENQPQVEILPEEWGARLSQAREARMLTLDQVAAELNLPRNYIEKLEAGALQGLPSAVFAKGYIRAYARLLNLADDQLVSDYEQIHGIASSKGQIRPVGKEHQQVKMNHPMMKLTTWLLLLAIIGVSVWWWQTQYGGGAVTVSSGESTSDASNGLAPVTLNNGTAELALPKLDDQEEGAGEAAGPADADLQEEPEPEYLSEEQIKKLQQNLDSGSTAIEETEAQANDVATAVSAVTEASVPDAAQTASISADFIAECWVSIKDADGKTLFNNLRGRGQSVNVSGKPPLNVLIGAADAVGRFSFNGEALDLAEYSRKNIIRINLPLSE